MMSPAKVCTMLDNLYLAFDELARKHKVFKVSEYVPLIFFTSKLA
jgi:hypothetical protein